MKRYYIVFVFIALVIVGVALTRKSSQDSTFRIGGIFILSGTGSNQGDQSQKGTQLAVEEINTSGGILGRKIEVQYEDNPGDDPKTAISALQKLKTQDVRIVLGTNWSPSGLAIAPVACREKTLIISPSVGVKDFNETCDWSFNLWPHDEIGSERLGTYLFEKGFRKITILGSLQEWEKIQATAVKRSFEIAGGMVVSFELPAKDEKEFRLEATKIKHNNPEAIVFTNFAYEDASARRLRELEVTAPFFSVLLNENHIQKANDAFEGTIVISSFTPSEEFVEKFVNTYNSNPDIGSDTAYDSVMLIKEAIEKTQSFDPKDIKEYLNSLKTYQGVSGKLTFDGKGGVTKEPRFMIVKNGKLEPLLSQ